MSIGELKIVFNRDKDEVEMSDNLTNEELIDACAITFNSLWTEDELKLVNKYDIATKVMEFIMTIFPDDGGIYFGDGTEVFLDYQKFKNELIKKLNNENI